MCHHLRVYAVIFIIVLRRKKTNQQEWHTRLSMLTELINPTETGTVVYTTEVDAVSTPCVLMSLFSWELRETTRGMTTTKDGMGAS